ncbi:Guanylate cyclase soluble subunit beta-2 [Quaeritorhiza haematococci]|nr:Guanylate cyclase soluble subunit beta-2 [Quaeritorhiza haematococci]
MPSVNTNYAPVEPDMDSSSPKKKGWKDKLDAIQSSNRLANNAELSIVYRAMFMWVGVTLYLGFLVLSGKHRPKAFDRGMADMWYWYTASAFFLGLTFAWMAYSSARTAEKRTLAGILLAVDAISMSTYVITAMRLTPTISGCNGIPVDPARFLEWISTCPVMIFLIGEITNQRKLARWTMHIDYILLVLGFTASVLREPFSHMASTGAVICFTFVVSGLWNMYSAPIEGKTKSGFDLFALKAARISTVGSWSCFPIIWHLQKNLLIPYSTAEALFCLADIIAKVFLTLVLANATVEQSQNERVEAMSVIANELEQQMSNSDKLLERMMPAGVLEQIKAGKGTQAEEYASVTVFFSDIANFTVLSSRTSTKDMLASLNKLWLEYDKVAKRWGIYKVETIGDAYLGVAGAPDRVPDHAERAINFSIDIIEMVRTFKTVTDEYIQIRIGLNSGPVTAGVLGDLNPHWCLVGDTVNTASRMESTSKPLMIHISDSTYQLTKGKFRFSEPEEMDVKGKGKMKTYWVLGRF